MMKLYFALLLILYSRSLHAALPVGCNENQLKADAIKATSVQLETRGKKLAFIEIRFSGLTGDLKPDVNGNFYWDNSRFYAFFKTDEVGWSPIGNIFVAHFVFDRLCKLKNFDLLERMMLHPSGIKNE